MDKKVETIMVSTDFSDCGNTAIKFAFDLARQLAAKVMVLHVVEKERHESGGYIDLTPVDSEEISKKEKKQALADMDKLLTSDIVDGVETEKVVQVDHKAEHGIVAAVKKNEPDLLVMASHGYSGFHRLLLGSTTDRIMRIVECPVLVIKEKCEMKA